MGLRFWMRLMTRREHSQRETGQRLWLPRPWAAKVFLAKEFLSGSAWPCIVPDGSPRVFCRVSCRKLNQSNRLRTPAETAVVA